MSQAFTPNDPKLKVESPSLLTAIRLSSAPFSDLYVLWKKSENVSQVKTVAELTITAEDLLGFLGRMITQSWDGELDAGNDIPAIDEWHKAKAELLKNSQPGPATSFGLVLRAVHLIRIGPNYSQELGCELEHLLAAAPYDFFATSESLKPAIPSEASCISLKQELFPRIGNFQEVETRNELVEREALRAALGNCMERLDIERVLKSKLPLQFLFLDLIKTEERTKDLRCLCGVAWVLSAASGISGISLGAAVVVESLKSDWSILAGALILAAAYGIYKMEPIKMRFNEARQHEGYVRKAYNAAKDALREIHS